MQAQTLPAPSRTDEQDTEPMAAVKITIEHKICGVNHCCRPVAVPIRSCSGCGVHMCRIHAQDAECPACAGGE